MKVNVLEALWCPLTIRFTVIGILDTKQEKKVNMSYKDRRTQYTDEAMCERLELLRHVQLLLLEHRYRVISSISL